MANNQLSTQLIKMPFHTLNFYTQRFQSVKRSNGKAPHKPVLLLSIIDLLETNGIKENRIPIDHVLEEIFKDNWRKLSIKNYRPTLENPLFYLQSDGFWKAYDTNGNQLKNKTAISRISIGKLDEDLFNLLQSDEFRPLLRMVLLDMLTTVTDYQLSLYTPLPNYIKDIEQEILAGYQQQKRQVTYTQEKFVRSYKFRLHLMNIYDYTCCMSGLKTDPDIGIVEACHIEEHNLQGNDALTNGIPLCRNLHQAFDRGIISIDDKYQVLIKSAKEFKESNSLYGIHQLAEKKILLPKEEKYYPSLEKLADHRNKFGFS